MCIRCKLYRPIYRPSALDIKKHDVQNKTCFLRM